MTNRLTPTWLRLKADLSSRWGNLWLKLIEVKLGLKLFYEKLTKRGFVPPKNISPVKYEKLSDLEKSHLDMDETHSFMDLWPGYKVRSAEAQSCRLQFKAFNETGNGVAVDRKGIEYVIDQDTVSSEPLWALWPGQWFRAQVAGAHVAKITSKERVPLMSDENPLHDAEELGTWVPHWDEPARVAGAKRRLLNGMPESTVRLIYGNSSVDQALKELKAKK